MEPSLEQFLKMKSLRVFRAWERFNSYKWEDLKIGTELVMLRSGYSGSAGVHRFVIGQDDKYTYLSDKKGLDELNAGKDLKEIYPRSLLSKEEEWHGNIEHFTDSAYILTDEDRAFMAQKIPYNLRKNYLNDKTGLTE